PLVLLTVLLPPKPTLFPYTTLFRSGEHCRLGKADIGHRLAEVELGRRRDAEIAAAHIGAIEVELEDLVLGVVRLEPQGEEGFLEDRKSTRLNSSHVKISYAVFCLKK